MNKKNFFLVFYRAGGAQYAPFSTTGSNAAKTIFLWLHPPVQRPVLLDSVNLNNTPFSEEMLLSYSVSFPEQERFTTELTPDSAGFFHLDKPEDGEALQLLSLCVSGDRYGKGKLTITSPNPLELWIDDVKRATKTQVNDSLHHSGSVDTNLNGFTNNARIVIKMLTSAGNKLDPAVKSSLSRVKKILCLTTHLIM